MPTTAHCLPAPCSWRRTLSRQTLSGSTSFKSWCAQSGKGGGARRRWIGGGWIGRLALTLMSSLLATARRDSAPPARLQLSSKVKAEIQALSSFGFQYLTHQYLPLKLQEGDWI